MTSLAPLRFAAYTVTTCLGPGRGALLHALEARRSGLWPCDFLDADIPTWIGRVEGLEEASLRSDLAQLDCRNHRLTQLALRQDGFEQAVLAARERYGPRRIAVILGTSTSGILETELAYRNREREGTLPKTLRFAQTHDNFALAEFVRCYFALEGPAHVISTACSSSAKTFPCAARWIAAGLCDAAIVGGSDSLCFTTLYGFASLGLTSPEPCRPFDAQRSGLSLAEAAGYVLLERSRGADEETDILYLGAGESADAYHMSSPHPDGTGVILSMQGALHAAAVQPHDIDYINCHGTASRANDAAEDQAIGRVFGGSVPCSSTKGWTGHALGAAGVTEAVIGALCIENGLIPGCLNASAIDPSFVTDLSLSNRRQPLRRVLSNSFGFGGTNCTLVFGRSGG